MNSPFCNLQTLCWRTWPGHTHTHTRKRQTRGLCKPIWEHQSSSTHAECLCLLAPVCATCELRSVRLPAAGGAKVPTAAVLAPILDPDWPACCAGAEDGVDCLAAVVAAKAVAVVGGAPGGSAGARSSGGPDELVTLSRGTVEKFGSSSRAAG